MSEIFLTVVNMSISAGWLVLVVLLLRLLLKKAPKWITVLLWGIVAVRLVCPFSFESVLSLIPSAQTINPEYSLNTPAIDSGVAIIDNAINPILSEATITVQPEKDINLFKFIVPYLAGLWLAGIVALLIYTLVSYLKVKNRIGTAVLLRDNIYQSENVVSPFVLGIIKPKIYLPFCMSEQDMQHVIAHENAHIRRKDHLWKPLGFLVLTLHWFNPLMWLGYVLLCRDIELACDEKVVKELSSEQKADYSQALLTCSVNRRMIAACPLAFGEVGVKDRVKSVLNYKKPAFWIIIVAIALSIIVAVCFLTNPATTTLNDELSVFIDTQIAEQNYSEEHTGDNFIAVSYEVLGVDKSSDETTVYMWVLYEEYSFEDGKIKLETGSHIPTAITAEQTGDHGHYELVEYWTPRDGSFYADDIREKFPLHLHSKALDPQRYIDKQKEFCQNSAEEYFRKEAEKQADEQSKLLEQLKETHSHFFNIPTEGGLTVYVWEWSPGIFQCHLANTQIDAQKGESFVYSVGYATVEEMKAILATYEIAQEDITIKAVTNPLSSYYREIDYEFKIEVAALFGFPEHSFSYIPALEVVYGDVIAEAVITTSTWSFKMADGTIQAICIDSSHPLELVDYMITKALKVTRRDESSLVASLKFDVAPDNITVNSWFFTEDGSTKAFDAEVDGLNIKLNPSKETCIYEVVATWKPYLITHYSGEVRYCFCVVEENNS